jgi:hypothetical protein
METLARKCHCEPFPYASQTKQSQIFYAEFSIFRKLGVVHLRINSVL